MSFRRAAVLGLLVLLAALAAAPLASQPAGQPGLRQAPPRWGAAIGAAGAGGTALTESPLFPMKAQGFWETAILAELPLFGSLALGFSLAYRFTAASDPAGGFQYRGHGGMVPAAYLRFKRPPVTDPARFGLQGGAAAGAAAAFERYFLTPLYFFYPSIFFEPFLEFHFPRLGPNTFSLSAPLRLDFRRDLDTSWAFGLGLGWRHHPKARKAKP